MKTSIELDNGNSKEYKVEAIHDIEIYIKELDKGYLLGFYYLISWKGYLEEEITLELALAIQDLRKLVTTFHRNHFEKLIATSLAIDSAPPIG